MSADPTPAECSQHPGYPIPCGACRELHLLNLDKAKPMGKQSRSQKIRTERPESVNAVNWDRRAFELYRAGLISLAALGADPNYDSRTNQQRSTT